MSDLKSIAFYLPQFHPVTENSEWWGPGFTEWTNVARAKPNYVGHYQPHVPRDLGFYDLRILDNMRAQIELAKLYGVHGFCFYYYWFDGRRILELPLDNYLESDIDFPFCVCWANENWTRTWDGLEKDVLLAQVHGEEQDRRFIQDLLPLLKDHRAIRVDGKPLLLVYRADLFPHARATTNHWREIARQSGLEGLHLVAVQFYGITDPRVYGFDAAVEFPPHTFAGSENRYTGDIHITNPEFTGGLIDYRKVIAQSVGRTTPDYRWYRGIVPSWDNTARRQNSSHTIVSASPELYRYWLRYLVEYTKKHNSSEDQLLFINAWNEWGEGCHLEPDLKYGHAYLEATYEGLRGGKDSQELLSEDEELLRLVGNEKLNKLIDQRNELQHELILMAAQYRNILQSHNSKPLPKFKLAVARRLMKYPRLFKFARRLSRILK